MKLETGQIVYHKDVYNYKEPLTVRGVIGLKVLLEGDFSGGTHDIIKKTGYRLMESLELKTIATSKNVEELLLI